MAPFRKVLIANRGEIAVRILRALREKGILGAVAYSDADRESLAVLAADEAYRIGPASSRESYLKAEALVDLAVEIGADAIHPGYGFLSERAEFSRLCRERGVVFIGPSPEAIAAMGGKVEARRRMIAAGVPVVPGSPGALADFAAARACAAEIGYPVIVKASAGGGGKGMRVAHDDSELAEGFRLAKTEAGASFGDDSVFLEKFVERPRHIEIQILGDQHGKVVSLGERECSLQRRHQKVVEEAPSTVVSPELRRRMGAAAVAAARAVGYTNAGTCEFLLDAAGNFYFLEMNTRLQVEHPVTEMVTQKDLVHLQIAVANGEPLPFRQEDLVLHGAAIECRVYAEDSLRFLPSPGKITLLRTPSGPYVRDDSGVTEGSEISVYYDPMISKLIVWAPTRKEAIGRMARALAEYRVGGIKTNLTFHRRVMQNAVFAGGDYSTAFIEENKAELLRPIEIAESDEALDAALAAAALETLHAGKSEAPSAQAGGNERSSWQRS